MWEQNTKRKDNSGNSENITLLGKDIRVRGVLRFEGTLQIEGHFEGEIHTKDVLVVGEQAVIKGTINAGTLISSGKIKGTITAAEKVQLLKSAILVGEVHSPLTSTASGAHFPGP